MNVKKRLTVDTKTYDFVNDTIRCPICHKGYNYYKFSASSNSSLLYYWKTDENISQTVFTRNLYIW